MHDPMTVAFEIKNPFARGPDKPALVTVWHVDPERDGSDDSCGWFMRSRHGDQAILDRIARRFAFEWSHGIPKGWFDEDGDPNYSPQAITLGMFRIAANEVFGHWSRRADRFLRRHLHDILHFAENNCDSMYTFIAQPYGKDGRVPPERRAREAAHIIYPWIIRADRPWHRHPRWHVHHWHLQIHPLQRLRRWLFSRCRHCGRRVGSGPVVGYGWGSPPRRWFESFRGERDVAHPECDAENRVGWLAKKEEPRS